LPLDTAVRGLPERHRTILIATYFRREPIDLAARRFGISPTDAKARLYHAMRELAAVVDESRSPAIR
jgi:DNA-directed RNA polymerase specialized sigma24 family protein